MPYYDSDLYEDCLHLLEVMSELIGYSEKKPKGAYIKQDINDKEIMDNIKLAFESFEEKLKNSGYFVITESKKVKLISQDLIRAVEHYLSYYNSLLSLVERVVKIDLEKGGLSNIAELSSGIRPTYELCQICCINAYGNCNEMIKV